MIDIKRTSSRIMTLKLLVLFLATLQLVKGMSSIEDGTYRLYMNFIHGGAQKRYLTMNPNSEDHRCSVEPETSTNSEFQYWKVINIKDNIDSAVIIQQVFNNEYLSAYFYTPNDGIEQSEYRIGTRATVGDVDPTVAPESGGAQRWLLVESGAFEYGDRYFIEYPSSITIQPSSSDDMKRTLSHPILAPSYGLPPLILNEEETNQMEAFRFDRVA